MRVAEASRLGGKHGVHPSYTRRPTAKDPFELIHRGEPAVFGDHLLATLRHEGRWILASILGVQRQYRQSATRVEVCCIG
jgi:hypothetical protein